MLITDFEGSLEKDQQHTKSYFIYYSILNNNKLCTSRAA